jgi:NADH dehydrogenase (ubiquinone) 1 beta subcomplex subunit 3
MGGHSNSDHGHHSKPIFHRSIIHYDIPEPAHPVADFKAPSWTKFKVENAPELVDVEQRLAKLGLKDPWLRNEVWRYDPQCGAVSARPQLLRSAGNGMKLGLILCIGTIILETAYGKLFGGKSDHHHHNGHH